MHFASQTSGVGPIRKKQENLLIVSHNPLQGYHFYKSSEKVGWAFLKHFQNSDHPNGNQVHV